MSFYDAYVGPGELYTTVAGALLASKTNICVIGNTDETDTWRVPAGECSVTIAPIATVYYHGEGDFIVSEEFIPAFYFSVSGGTILYESMGKMTNTTTLEGSLVKLNYITINSTHGEILLSSENITVVECSMNINSLNVSASRNVGLQANTFIGNVVSSSVDNIVTFQNNIVYGSVILKNNPDMIRLESNKIGFLNITGDIDNMVITSNLITYVVAEDITIKNSVISTNIIDYWNLKCNLIQCTLSSNTIKSNVYIHDVSDTYITDNSTLDLYIGTDSSGIPSISETTITGNTIVNTLYINSGVNDSNVIQNNTVLSIVVEGEVIDLTLRNNLCDNIELRGRVTQSHLENNNTNTILILGLLDSSVIVEEKNSTITLADVNSSSIMQNFSCKFYCKYFKRSSFALNYSDIVIDKCKYAQIIHNNSNIKINRANRSIIQGNIGKISVRSVCKSIIDSNISIGCK